MYVGLKLYNCDRICVCVCVCTLAVQSSHVNKYCVLCAAPLGEQVAVEDVEQGHGRAVEEQEICGQQRGGGGGR